MQTGAYLNRHSKRSKILTLPVPEVKIPPNFSYRNKAGIIM